MVKSRTGVPRRAKAQRTTERLDDTRRIADMIDLATGAKTIADTLGERFLAYLLAMVIQEMSDIEGRRANATSKKRPHAEETAKPPS